MIVTTEGIILNTRKHGETSKIVWIYTSEYGKVSVIAKGAREMKSKFGGALEMFARSSITFYKKERADALYLLSKAESLDSHRGILTSLESMEAASQVVELIVRTIHDEEKNPELFDLLSATLQTIGTHPNAARTLLLVFCLQYARVAGFEIRVELEDERARSGQYRFHHTTGEVHLYDTSRDFMPGTAQLSSRAALTLQELSTCSVTEATGHGLESSVVLELRSVLLAYFAHHFVGFSSKSLKSGSVFHSL